MSSNDFGYAIKLLLEGKKVARKGWNGKDMWLIIVPAQNWKDVPASMSLSVYSGQFIAIKTVKNILIPWFASQEDMLSDDWIEIKSEG